MWLEGDIGSQALDNLGREILGESEVLQAFQVSVQAAVVHDGLSTVEIDVRMTTQLLQRQLVDVQLLGMGILHDEVLLGILGKAIYLVQLVDADVATQALPIADNLCSIVSPDAGHLAQHGGIGRVQHHLLTLGYLHGVAQGITLIVFLLDQGGGRQIVAADADIRLQATVVLDGEPIESGKVLLLAIDTPTRAILIYITHLPGLQSQS